MLKNCSHLSYLALLLSMFLTSPTVSQAEGLMIVPARPRCDRLLQPGPAEKIAREQLFNIVYMAVDAGSSAKLVAKPYPSGRRDVGTMLGFYGETYQWPAMVLEPGTKELGQFYLGRLTRGFGATGFSLFNLDDKRMASLVNENFDLTWSQYNAMNTVSAEDIAKFARTEESLPYNRKITFVSETRDRKVATVVRLYDGTPYPIYYLGKYRELPEDLAPQGDYKIPVERRYTHLNFREDGHYIYEAGRQANAPGIENAFKHQVATMADYFMTKFGTDRVAPESYRKGRIYVELTGKHLAAYLADVKNGGLGFQIFAMAKNGEEMKRVPPTMTLRELSVARKDNESRFILYKTMENFVMDFHTMIEHSHF